MSKEIEKACHMNESYGEVRIADDVVANIAGIAATEIEGVACTASNMTNEFMSKMGVKSYSQGVRVRIENGVVSVSMALIMKYGFNIPVTCKSVQERVKTSIENMTGLTVDRVAVKIVDIDMSAEE